MAKGPGPALVGFADIRTEAIDDWQEYHKEGEQFLHLAENAFEHNNQAFTMDILYNLIAMGIEKVVMSSLMEIGQLPYNHTMRDLADALEKWLPAGIGDLGESIRHLDSYQDICDPYACTIRVPTRDEIQSMLHLARQLEAQLQAARP